MFFYCKTVDSVYSPRCLLLCTIDILRRESYHISNILVYIKHILRPVWFLLVNPVLEENLTNIHEVANEVYFKFFLRMDVTFRDESNNFN